MFVIVAEARSAERWHGTSSARRCHATTHEIAYRGALAPHAETKHGGRRKRHRRRRQLQGDKIQEEEYDGEEEEEEHGLNQGRRYLSDESKAAKKAERKAWRASNKAAAAATATSQSSVEATKHNDDYEYRGDSTDDTADPPKVGGPRSGLVRAVQRDMTLGVLADK